MSTEHKPASLVVNETSESPEQTSEQKLEQKKASEEILEGIVPEPEIPSVYADAAQEQEAAQTKAAQAEASQTEPTQTESAQTNRAHDDTSFINIGGAKPQEESTPPVVNSFADLEKKKRTPPPRKTPEQRALEEEEVSPEEKERRKKAIAESMTLMQHLNELRSRLVRSFMAIGLAFIVCYTFAEQLFAELCKPLIAALPAGSKLIFTALPEAFFVYVQVGLLAALFVSSPFIFYQIWSFIAPGLYDDEKKYMIPMAVISAGFFIAGASFCFFMVFPYAFTFFVGFASESIAAMPSLSEYLSFAMKLLIAFGLIFEMPLFTFFLARMRVVTAASMRKFRKYAVLCSFIVAAILTPPDVISQLLMAFPMMLLYEMSIGVAAIFGRKKKPEDDDADNADKADKEDKDDDAENEEKVQA